MQVEGPSEIICAYATQVVWLERKLEKLRKDGQETNPAYAQTMGELTGCRNAHDKMKAILAEPKGQWVQVLRSKAPGLEKRVGLVTYVNTKHGFASVVFGGDPKPRNLGLSKLLVISLPAPTMKIPCAGMRVTFKDDPTEYVSITWESTRVRVEPVSMTTLDTDAWDRYTKRTWMSRTDIETINGSSPT